MNELPTREYTFVPVPAIPCDAVIIGPPVGVLMGTVIARLTAPDGTVSIVADGVGLFVFHEQNQLEAHVTLDQAGVWEIAWEGVDGTALTSLLDVQCTPTESVVS